MLVWGHIGLCVWLEPRPRITGGR